jgi:hypothetical protein
VLIAGDEASGYSICAKLVDKDLADPRNLALQSLSKDWPLDEWTKFYSVSLSGRISTVELDLELHGPWVWELYNVMEPEDYFKRFDAAVICANPKRPGSLADASTFVESMNRHIGRRIPMFLVVDLSLNPSKDEIELVREMAVQLDMAFEKVRVSDGDNIENLFKTLANELNILSSG